MIYKYLLVRKSDNIVTETTLFNEIWDNIIHYFLKFEYDDGTTEFNLPEDRYNMYDNLIFDLLTVLTQEELGASDVVKQVSDGSWDHTITVDAYKVIRKNEVKAEAGRRITGSSRDDDVGQFLSLVEWKQRNYITRCLQLIKAAVDAEHSKDIITNLTAEEQAEYAALEGCWDDAVDIRTASNTIEGDVDNAADCDALSAIDIEGNNNWPVE